MDDALPADLLSSTFLRRSPVRSMDVWVTLLEDAKNVQADTPYCIILANCLTVWFQRTVSALNATQTMCLSSMEPVSLKMNFVRKWINTVPASNAWTNTITPTNQTDVWRSHLVASMINMKSATNAMHPLPLTMEDASSKVASILTIMAAVNAGIPTLWPSPRPAKLQTVSVMIRINTAVPAEADMPSQNNTFASCKINTVHPITMVELNVFSVSRGILLTPMEGANMLISIALTSTNQASA